MTSLNLATIFGPNLLHKQKKDKEFAVESFARAEESTAIISVVQRMINTYDTLFMVSRAHCKPEGMKTVKGGPGFNQTISGYWSGLFVYGEFFSLIEWSILMKCKH